MVDTLKLRIHVGPYLREVFKDPTKKKVGYVNMLLMCLYDKSTYLMLIFTLIRSCMEQIEILYGFNGILAYICAICLTRDRF